MLSLFFCVKMKTLVQHFGLNYFFFFNDPQTKAKLKIEIAATVDWGEPFVKACYHLEGDGPLALECYETVDQISALIATENIPNVRAVSQYLTRMPPTHPLHEQWVTYARACVQGGIDYLNNHLASSLKIPLEIFKTCRLFSPQRVREIKPTASSLDQSLTCLPFLSASERESLKEELPTYLARVNSLHEEFDPLDWWKSNTSVLPNWSAIAKKIILILLLLPREHSHY